MDTTVCTILLDSYAPEHHLVAMDGRLMTVQDFQNLGAIRQRVYARPLGKGWGSLLSARGRAGYAVTIYGDAFERRYFEGLLRFHRANRDGTYGELTTKPLPEAVDLPLERRFAELDAALGQPPYLQRSIQVALFGAYATQACRERGEREGGAAMGAGRPTGAAADFTFLLCSDLHAQDVPQGERILRDILAAARGANADFIVQLGDFLRPNAAALRAIWEDKDPETGFAGGRYLAIGNHDLDSFSREAFCKAFIDTADPHTPTAAPYYSFDHKGVHFVFLDGNLTNTSFRLDDAQLAWLRRDLEAAQCRCLLFSHESIDHELANGREIQALLGEVNRAAGWRKVVAAFSGHNHSNYDRSIGGIRYIQIHSAAYVWIGKDTQAENR